MRYTDFGSILVAFSVATSSIAGTMESVGEKSWRWVDAISIGSVWENAGQTQTFYLAPDIIKTYDATKGTHALAEGELFVGIQKELSHMLQAQLGFAVTVTGNASLSGFVWDDAEPQFDNYSYSYQVQHSHIAVKGKLLADRGYWLVPWVSASIGVGFNEAHGFQNTPLISEAVTMANFAYNTEMDFTYNLGVGVQKSLNAHWQVGAGYEFADWGHSQLNPASGQTLNSGLKLNHLYTNGILFNFTYVA